MRDCYSWPMGPCVRSLDCWEADATWLWHASDEKKSESIVPGGSQQSSEHTALRVIGGKLRYREPV